MASGWDRWLGTQCGLNLGIMEPTPNLHFFMDRNYIDLYTYIYIYTYIYGGVYVYIYIYKYEMVIKIK